MGSAALEQVSDNVISMSRAADESALYGSAQVTLGKLRSGRCGRLGSCELGFHRPGERFFELEKHREEDAGDEGISEVGDAEGF